MLMQNFLRDRKSYREFRNKKANKDILNQVDQAIDEVLKEAQAKGVGMDLKLHIEGKDIFKELENVGGYAGIMIDSPHYISLQTKNVDEQTQVYSSYFTEKLITKINAIGLEACWITLDHVESFKKVKAFGDIGKNIDYALAIGYPPRNNPFVKGASPSERMGVDELVFQDTVETPIDMQWLDDRSLDDLFYYVRFAPSTRNSQPWRFLLKNNKVKLLMAYCNPEDISLIDAGVMMYYFEEMAKSIGINREWKLIDGNCVGKKAQYKYIAEYEI